MRTNMPMKACVARSTSRTRGWRSGWRTCRRIAHFTCIAPNGFAAGLDKGVRLVRYFNLKWMYVSSLELTSISCFAKLHASV